MSAQLEMNFADTSLDLSREALRARCDERRRTAAFIAPRPHIVARELRERAAAVGRKKRQTVCPNCGFDRWKDRDPRHAKDPENSASLLRSYGSIREGFRYGPEVEACLRCGMPYEIFVPGRDHYCGPMTAWDAIKELRERRKQCGS